VKIEFKNNRQVVSLADGENVLITFEGLSDNLLLSYQNQHVTTSWSKTPDIPGLPDGFVIEPGSERDFADLIDDKESGDFPGGS
jgi:hypothetical protein